MTCIKIDTLNFVWILDSTMDKLWLVILMRLDCVSAYAESLHADLNTNQLWKGAVAIREITTTKAREGPRTNKSSSGEAFCTMHTLPLDIHKTAGHRRAVALGQAICSMHCA